MSNSTLNNDPSLWQDAWPRRSNAAHKYHHGHALIVGGYPITGAARLAARAAARSGAGVTTVAVPEAAFPIYATSLTSIMVYPLVDDGALRKLITEQDFSAFLIGPGAGVGTGTRSHVLTLLAANRPTLLDADALTTFVGHQSEFFAALHGDCVLTPHEGEFVRLFEWHGGKVERALAASAACGAVIVLKGRETVIAAPDGRAIVNHNAPPTLATAGSGDVLSGIICGLLAQGMEAFFAAAAGVWMHGAAANAFGMGLIADDLPDLLPAVLSGLEVKSRVMLAPVGQIVAGGPL